MVCAVRIDKIQTKQLYPLIVSYTSFTFVIELLSSCLHAVHNQAIMPLSLAGIKANPFCTTFEGGAELNCHHLWCHSQIACKNGPCPVLGKVSLDFTIVLQQAVRYLTTPPSCTTILGLWLGGSIIVGVPRVRCKIIIRHSSRPPWLTYFKGAEPTPITSWELVGLYQTRIAFIRRPIQRVSGVFIVKSSIPRL